MTDSFTLVAGWILDGTGGPIRRNVLLRVEGGVIVSLEPVGGGVPPQGDLLDLTDCTLLPPLVDSHVHLSMSGSGDPEVRRKQLCAPYGGVRHVIEKHKNQHLAHGVLAVRDGGDHGSFALKYKRESLPSGNVPLLLRCAGRAWHAPGRYGTLIGRPPPQGVSLSQAVARGEEGIDHVKMVQSGLNSLKDFGKETPPQFGLEDLRGAVEAAKRLGLRTMVHANGRTPVRLAIEAGCDSVEHGFFMGRDNLKRMADKGIVWVPTAVTMKGYSEMLDPRSLEAEVARRTLEDQLEQIRMGVEEGVTIALGTDSGSLGVHHGGAVLEELGLLIHGGFPLEKAIQCATTTGAQLLDLEEGFGCIQTKNPARFLVVRGNPSLLPGSLRFPEVCFRGEWWKMGEGSG
jgi:imidazolonepropionase-like amidohydrolase